MLFAKYIAYDKSDTFSSSVPATPTLVPPTNAHSTSNKTQSSCAAVVTGPHCPFTFSENSTPVQPTGSVVRHRAAAVPLTSAMGSMQGIRSSGRNLSAILEKDTVEEARTFVGNGSLPPIFESKPVSYSTVAIQTEGNRETELQGSERPMFSVGPVDRKTSVASCSSSTNGDENQCKSSSPVVPVAATRDLDTCLELYKSDVSGWFMIGVGVMVLCFLRVEWTC